MQRVVFRLLSGLRRPRYIQSVRLHAKNGTVMAKQYLYVFIVHGRQRFPVDMLRYDRATPHREQDSHQIIPATGCHSGGTIAGYDIELQSHRPPTEARWRSFGWEVTETQKITVSP
jgi:hypothetical protein